MARGGRSGEKARPTIAEAATGAVNLAALAAGAIGAAALHSIPIAALGGIAYAALVAWDVVGERGGAKPRVSSLPDPKGLADAQTRAAIETIRGARRELDKVLAETSPDVQAHLAMALVSVDELEGRAASLAARAEDIARYLATTDARAVQRDIDQLAQRVTQTRDAEARAQYETARAARAEHLHVLVELANAKERIGASLLSIAATTEALPAKVVRMRALDAQAMDALSGSVKDELDEMNGEMRTLEETLTTLSQVTT